MMKIITALQVEQHGSVSCVHLQAPDADTLRYVASERAIADGVLEVREVSEAGDVNALEVVNGSEQYVFMMDGDILEGAKQTRVLNTSVFLAPSSRCIIPVSCVEQGRWHYTSRSFRGSHTVAPRTVRAAKSSSVLRSLRSGRPHHADQGEVWKQVRSLDQAHHVASPTLSLPDTYAHLEKNLDDLVLRFKGCAEANGFALFVGTQLLGVDVFNRRDVCAAYLPKILRAVAIEAVHLGADTPCPQGPEASYLALDFLDRIEDCPTELHPAVALGGEQRFDNDIATGFALIYLDSTVHFTAMAVEKTPAA